MEEKYRYISNKPCGKDLFGSKVHEKISIKLSNTIKQNNIRVIGLEGGLGSGKSNIIKLVEKELKKDYHLFIFDAWSYQEDLKRRAFLEELTENLTNAKFLKNNDWEKKLNDLLARKTEETTKTIPQFSDSLLIISFTIYFNGLLNKISNETLNKLIPETLIEFYKNLNIYLKVISLGLVKNAVLTLVIIYYLVKFIRNFYKKHKKNKKKYPKKYFCSALWKKIRETFYIYKEKELDKTVQKISSTKEPTVKQFNNWMKDLDNDLNKKLIIVFDNMDRVSEDKVKSLWGMIHTFFAENNYEKISLIVPFDREQLNKLFSKNISEETNNKEKEGDLLISKTFSRVYSIPLLVMSDWEKFFIEKLKEAIIGITEEEVIKMKNIYDIKTSKKIPREIINFINRLVSQKEYWEEEIPIEYLVIFELEKERILKAPAEEIIKQDYLEEAKHLFFNKDKLSEYIAALVYGVEPREASQVLLENEIINNLNKNLDKINILEGHPQFYNVLNKCIDKTSNFENTINAIEKLENVKEQIEYKHIWEVLTEKISDHKREEYSFGNYLKILLKNSNKKKKVLDYTLNGATDFETDSGDRYAKVILEIENFVTINIKDINFINTLKSRAFSPKEYIEAIKIFGEKYKKYKIKTNGLDDYLEENATKINQGEGNNCYISYLKNENLDKFKEKIKALMKLKDIKDIEKIYEIAFNIFDEPLNKIPKDWMTESEVYTTINNSTNEKKGENILIAIFLMNFYKKENIFTFDGYAQSCLNIIQSKIQNNDNLEIIKYLEYVMEFDEILNSSLDNSDSEYNAIMKKIGEHIIEKNIPYGSKINIENILKNYSNVKKEYELESDKVIKSFNSWFKYKGGSINVDDIKEIFERNDFILDSLDVKCELSDEVKKIYVERLKSVNKSEYLDEFKKEQFYNIEIIKELVEKEDRKIPNNLKLAYKEKLEEIAESKMLINENNKEILYWLKRNITSELVTRYKNVRDEFIKKSDISIELFQYFWSGLLEHGHLKEKAEEVVRRIILPVLDDENCLNLFLEDHGKIIEVIISSGNSLVEFKEKMRGIYEENRDSNLKEFLEKIGVDFPREKEKEKEEFIQL